MGMIRNHLFLQIISLNLRTLPHDMPTMAKSTPLNPHVASVMKHGRNEQSTDRKVAAYKCSSQGIIQRQSTFAAKCQTLAWLNGYSRFPQTAPHSG